MTKMNIEVGEYIRTKQGTIGKAIEKYEKYCVISNTRGEIDVPYENIVKHSKNIIDLIEVGDYVNGCLIVKIYKDPFIEGQINLWTNMLFPNKYYKEKITDKNIKSIVTKEQFYNKEYRL